MTERVRPTPYDDLPDLDLVASDLACHRFSKEETLSGKTPDFRVRKGGAIVAYCEVKAPQDDPWFADPLRHRYTRLSATPGRTRPSNDWLGRAGKELATYLRR